MPKKKIEVEAKLSEPEKVEVKVDCKHQNQSYDSGVQKCFDCGEVL